MSLYESDRETVDVNLREPMMRVLQLEGLKLEPLRATHAAEMFRVLADPAIYAHEMSAPESLSWLTARYLRLETRLSADGREQWLNWVIRLETGPLIGFVQATILASGESCVAYVLASRYWGSGHASAAVTAMIHELRASYGVTTCWAILQRANARSRRLLDRLGFSEVTVSRREHQVAAGELLMTLRLAAIPETGE